MKRYVVMLSSGMDSALNLLMSLEKGEVVVAITVDYGQRAASREVERSAELCRRTGVNHRVLRFPWLGEISGGALIKPEKPAGVSTLKDIHPDKLDALWIPNRNGLFANVGACFAEAMGAHYVVMGLNEEEGQVFPDNTAGFVEAINQSFRVSTRTKVELLSHTLRWNKEKIARELAARGFDFSLLWSCYNGGMKMCGDCPSCKRLIDAAKKADIIYQLMPLIES